MGWWDVDPELAVLFDRMAGPGAYYAAERRFWLALWRVPILEAVDEDGFEVRHYGPVRAFASPGEPRASLFNVLLGADSPHAIARGHLAEALEWTESMGLDVRIPLRRAAEFGESAEAEAFLDGRGYRRTGALGTFARAAGPACFPAPPGIEIEEIVDDSMAETFACVISPAYGFDPLANDFFVGLPGERGWRTYIAADDSGAIAAAATMMDYERPQLGFAGTLEECRGRGGHMALLHRSLEDIAATRASEVLAITEESLDFPATAISAGARNLLRAGFQLRDVRTLWQPPEELLAPRDPDEDEDEDGWADGDWHDGRGPDEDPPPPHTGAYLIAQ
jgi:hypothetical protein